MNKRSIAVSCCASRKLLKQPLQIFLGWRSPAEANDAFSGAWQDNTPGRGRPTMQPLAACRTGDRPPDVRALSAEAAALQLVENLGGRHSQSNHVAIA
jgi:hypothetical protein